MFFKVLRDIAKPQWFDIISRLKKSTGLSVAELSESIGMSYMGIKQHCVELNKRGYYAIISNGWEQTIKEIDKYLKL